MMPGLKYLIDTVDKVLLLWLSENILPCEIWSVSYWLMRKEIKSHDSSNKFSYEICHQWFW